MHIIGSLRYLTYKKRVMVQVKLPLDFKVFAQGSTSVRTVWHTARRLNIPQRFVAFIDCNGNAFQLREKALLEDFSGAIAEATRL